MNSEEELLKKRFKDLCDKAYNRDICTFTGFLGLLEMDIYYRMKSELSYVETAMSGGCDGCERQIIRFGNLNTPFPISCIHITPCLKKFSDELNHRDFLGALINLGIKRETLGDIIISDNEAYVFCLDTMQDFICDNLTRIKHTSVKCEIAASSPESFVNRTLNIELNVASLRLDAVVSEVYKLSRSQSQAVIKERRVFINGRLIENNSQEVKPNDKITVRGMGKFIFGETVRTTKKGRFFINVQIFI